MPAASMPVRFSHHHGFRWARLPSVAAAFLVVLAGFSSVAAQAPKPMPAEWQDPLFTEPFIDVDEWRDTPVRHRYIHGGFKGSDLLFSIYLPPKELYQGRFFQPVAAMPGSENSAQASSNRANVNVTQENTSIGFAVASGAYLVESNQGSRTKYPTGDRTITGYRASAAVAKFSRELAAKMYGPHRPYGYAFGGSGGGFKTISFAESTRGIWDGVVPYVIPTPTSLPNSLVAQAQAVRLVGDKFPMVVDAIDPGGSGNMYAGLNAEQAAALREVTRLGMPPRAWFAYERLGWQAVGGLIDELVLQDPEYFAKDFWNVPGYLGASPPKSLTDARIRVDTRITRIVMADELRRLASSDELAEKGLRVTSAAIGNNVVPAAFEFAELPKGDLKGTTIRLKSGDAAGQVVWIAQVVGNLATIDIGQFAFPHVNKIQVGDEVNLDNSIYLASQTYQRHQVPSAEFRVFDQYRKADGTPLYPQRPKLVGYWFAERAAGSVQSGVFGGKMIVVQTMVDEGAYPWKADWYRSKVRDALGAETDDRFRLYYIDHAMHGPPPPGPASARIVSYTNALQQALRDLSAWVEKGIAPPATTAYTVNDGQVLLPPGAAARKGIQPVVTLTVNGGKRADVKVGQPVNFVAVVEAPPGTGSVVRADWDFEGLGTYPVNGVIEPDPSGARASVRGTHTFTRPGTYFPVLRAASQRRPDGTPYAQIETLDRVRVVVTGAASGGGERGR